tara:strand:+ start:557 stop:670 length:114 start_codon:yes stop_codon:yes gene_type:complete
MENPEREALRRESREFLEKEKLKEALYMKIFDIKNVG